MARFAIIDLTGNVVNCVEWRSPQDEWLPPRNHYVIESVEASIGDLYDFDKKAFTKFYERPGYNPNPE